MYLCKRKYKIYLWFVMIGVFSLTGQQEDRKRLAISPFEKLKISSNIGVNLIQSDIKTRPVKERWGDLLLEAENNLIKEDNAANKISALIKGHYIRKKFLLYSK